MLLPFSTKHPVRLMAMKLPSNVKDQPVYVIVSISMN